MHRMEVLQRAVEGKMPSTPVDMLKVGWLGSPFIQVFLQVPLAPSNIMILDCSGSIWMDLNYFLQIS